MPDSLSQGNGPKTNATKFRDSAACFRSGHSTSSRRDTAAPAPSVVPRGPVRHRSSLRRPQSPTSRRLRPSSRPHFPGMAVSIPYVPLAITTRLYSVCTSQSHSQIRKGRGEEGGPPQSDRSRQRNPLHLPHSLSARTNFTMHFHSVPSTSSDSLVRPFLLLLTVTCNKRSRRKSLELQLRRRRRRRCRARSVVARRAEATTHARFSSSPSLLLLSATRCL